MRLTLPARTASGAQAGARIKRDSIEKAQRSEEHTSELQSQSNLVCRLLLEKKKKQHIRRRAEQQVDHCYLLKFGDPATEHIVQNDSRNQCFVFDPGTQRFYGGLVAYLVQLT